MKFNFNFNGKDIEVDSPSNIRLSVLIRETMSKKTVKQSCGCGKCGFCLVLVDDKPIYSCIYPAAMVQGKKVITIDFISQKNEYANIVKGFEEANVDLCPNCAPSRILLTYNLLQKSRELSEEMLDRVVESINCDCTDIRNLKEAIFLAANFYSGGS